jgi:hypothetical protein
MSLHKGHGAAVKREARTETFEKSDRSEDKAEPVLGLRPTNLVAIPVAAGALYPSLGLLLRPEFGAVAMSASSITVVTNALLLRRTERDLT